MPTETIRPTAHQVTAGDVVDPAYAYDGNTANVAKLNAANIGDDSQVLLYTFEDDTSPDGRDELLLDVSAQWGPTDLTYDKGVMYFRKVSTDAFTQIASYTGGSGWSTLGQSWETIDITALAGSQPSSDWQLVVQFYNGDGSSGGPPVPIGV